MPRRIEHNIESNCVSFDDDCWNEQTHDSYYESIIAMDKEEKAVVSKVVDSIKDFIRNQLV